MDWSDVADLALAIFLVLVGVGLAYAFYRLAGLLLQLTRSVGRMTDETLPILTRAQTTMDGVNAQLGHVDEIMQSAVGATKGAERAVSGVTNTVSAPVRKLSGMTSAAQEAIKTFRARRAAGRADGDITARRPVVQPDAVPPATPPAAAPHPHESPYPAAPATPPAGTDAPA
mgnify:CR=1 FL=1